MIDINYKMQFLSVCLLIIASFTHILRKRHAMMQRALLGREIHNTIVNNVVPFCCLSLFENTLK